MNQKFMQNVLVGLLVAATLSGCTDASGTTGDLVVKSQPVEVRSLGDATNTTTVSPNQPVNVEKTKAAGHIAGVVVDPTIRPIAGARVRLPSLDLVHPSDRDGVFSFTDLYPGAYYVIVNVTGYQTAQTFVQVEPDEFVRVKFILTPIPPPEPYHTTLKFEGFADVSSDPVTDIFGTGLVCGGCDFEFDNSGNARTIILEAVMDPYQWTGTSPTGGNSFQYQISGPEYGKNKYGQGPNPMRAEFVSGVLPVGTLRLTVAPAAFPLPETSKAFEVFVTSWYNSDPPLDWSIVNGDV